MTFGHFLVVHPGVVATSPRSTYFTVFYSKQDISSAKIHLFPDQSVEPETCLFLTYSVFQLFAPILLRQCNCYMLRRLHPKSGRLSRYSNARQGAICNPPLSTTRLHFPATLVISSLCTPHFPPGINHSHMSVYATFGLSTLWPYSSRYTHSPVFSSTNSVHSQF